MPSAFPPVPSASDSSTGGRPPINIHTPNVYSGLTPATSTSTNTTALQHTYLHRPQISDSMLTSANSDLERLERLKKEILEGQNPYYQPIAQPDFLENIYLGRRSHNQNTVLGYSELSASNSQLRSELSLDVDSSHIQSKEKMGDVTRDQYDVTKRVEPAQISLSNNQENITGGSPAQFKPSHAYQAPNAFSSQNVSQHGKPVVSLKRMQLNDINTERVIGNGRESHSNDNKEKLGLSYAENSSSGRQETYLLQRRGTGTEKEESLSNSGFSRGYGTDGKSVDRFAASYSNPRTSGHADLSGPRFLDRVRERHRDQEHDQDKLIRQDKEKKLERHNENRRIEENVRIIDNQPPIYNPSAQRFIARSTELNTGNSGSFDPSRKEAVSRPALEDRISRPPGQTDRSVLHVATDDYVTRSSEIEGNTIQSGANADEKPLSMPEKAGIISHSTKTPLPLEARLSLTTPIKKEQPTDRLPPSLEERISSRVFTIGENVTNTPKTTGSEVTSDTPLPSLQERITNRPSLEERIGGKTFETAVDNLSQATKNYIFDLPAQDQTKRTPNDDKDNGSRSNDDRSRSHETEVLSRRGAASRPPYDFDNRQTSTPVPHMKSRLHYEPSRNISPRRMNSADILSREPYRERGDFRHGVDAYGREATRSYNEDRRADNRGTPLHELGLLQGRQDRFSRDPNDRYGPPVSDGGRPVPTGTREYRNSWDRDELSSRAEYVDRIPQRELWEVEIPGDRRSSLPPPSSWDRSEPLSHNRPANFHRESFHLREFERSRYPPDDHLPPNTRIRPRSPSPLRSGVGHAEDARPFKRIRETPYYTGPPREIPLLRDTYYDRRPTESRDNGDYYESRDFLYASRDTAPQMRERSIDPVYDRRALDVLPPRSPPFHTRTPYPRADNRNNRHFVVPPGPGT